MSYGAAAALQAAVWQRLEGDPALAGVGIHDALPPGGSGSFVLIGPGEVRDASDKSAAGAEHRLVISVISDAAGFFTAKTVAAAVCDALAGPLPPLSRGRLVSLSFLRAEARRLDAGAVRRIDLTFRARTED
ncbi:DUF3168 domain-containing protein [Pseudogemmobacter humi]|uniref:DUF3168 domain-containing protein n=1 Tax=Pseudogemmobacter humi TaxID=2483812 RepID=A0A3P5XM24_9RHOB|nr:DUF3168 domain-containing protein [Pseudogemmobacter humi]VDC31785.1 hypothetical protein XINFAN_03139 [Pseudogemmobacter humi]